MARGAVVYTATTGAYTLFFHDFGVIDLKLLYKPLLFRAAKAMRHFVFLEGALEMHLQQKSLFD